MRTPNRPPRPHIELRTLSDYAAAGIVLVSHCGAGLGHTQMLDLDALIAKHGPTAKLDQAFRRALHCPVCGAMGGGLEIRPPMDFIR